MKDTMKNSLAQIAFFACAAAIALAVAGCNSPGKVRDIELKGMYVNGYSEVLAIGQGKLTSIPGEREALAAHYSEDTSWLSPSTKTHALDIFLVGMNSVENAKDIIKSICEAFKEVAPTVSSNNAQVAKGGVNAFSALGSMSKDNAEVELGKVNAALKQVAADKSAASTNAVGSVTTTNAAYRAECEAK
jgi:hypothetical protein